MLQIELADYEIEALIAYHREKEHEYAKDRDYVSAQDAVDRGDSWSKVLDKMRKKAVEKNAKTAEINRELGI